MYYFQQFLNFHRIESIHVVASITTKKLVNNFIQHQFKSNVRQDLLFEQKMAMNITEAILYAKQDELYLKDSNVPKVSR